MKWNRSVLLACLAGTALSVGMSYGDEMPSGKAAKRPAHHAANKFAQEGYPFFDIRRDEAGRPTAEVTAAISAARGQAQFAMDARTAAETALRAKVPSVIVTRDALLDLPFEVLSTSEWLTAGAPNEAARRAPEGVVREFLTQFGGVFELSPETLNHARLARGYKTDHNGVTHLDWHQQHNGADIVGCTLRANVLPDGRLMNIGSSMLPRPEGGFQTPAIAISPLDALRIAMENVGIKLESEPTSEIAGGDAEANWQDHRRVWRGVTELRPDEQPEVMTRLVYFPKTRADLRPAWAVVVPTPGVGHTYDIIVDAVDGTVLQRENRLVFETTQPMTFRVYRKDSPAPGSPGNPTPNGFQFPFIERSLVVIQPEDIRDYSPDGWIPDGQSETIGNNAAVASDTNNDNQPDLPRPNGGPNRVFDFPYDHTQQPPTYRDYAVVQMFYYANMFHDRLYAMGFNEAAGNFQVNNFGRGGVGNDSVVCDVHDGGGTNNANWQGTGEDGSFNRVQMYIFPAGSFTDRDGALDGDVVYHELAHGLSTRLHRGLTGTQPRAMGEGWGDYFGISLNMEPGDDPDGNYCTGGYVTFGFPSGSFTDNYYYGIRRFPYSTNLNVNPATFADIDPDQISFPPDVPRSPIIGNTADQVHNAGEVWCNTLMEARANLWRRHGYDGNLIMMTNVVDGMKLSLTSTPTYLHSRNVIIQADNAANNGDNRVDIWRGFAKRGMGFSATGPDAGTTRGIVEAFDTPEQAIFTFPEGLPTRLDPAEPVSISVMITPFNLELVADSGRVYYSTNGGEFTQAAMTPGAAPGEYTAVLPGVSCFDQVRFYFDVNTSVGVRLHPDSGAANAYTAQAYTGVAMPINDTAETDIGWTITNSPDLTDGAWERGVPRNFGRGDPPADFDGSGQCWLTDNDPNTSNSDVDNGSTTITSPVFATRAGDTLSFAAWLGSITTSLSAGDGLFIEYTIDPNAATWLPLRSYTTPANTWRSERLIVGTDLQPGETMRIRVRAADINPGNVVEAAFDAFKVERLVCETTGGCIADFNGDGGVDGADVEAFFLAWEIGESQADVNEDGGVDGADVEVFFIAWESGEC
ncbi:MAG: M36 family metallopeptidase [Phycisphaeraceae bacterium]|nr:M36 family metallopeptidase [Phycisphaeraceae bacterium]